MRYIDKILEALKTAKSESSPECVDGLHEFKIVMYTDLCKLYECKRCGEYVKVNPEHTPEGQKACS